MTPTEQIDLRGVCADRLEAAANKARELTAFIGFDGFVDEIIQVVDKRTGPSTFERLPTIAGFAARIAEASGRSTNIELVRHLTKLGGNGPIMSNALAALGLKVTYLGILGRPALHPVFEEFAKRAEVHSLANPGYTDALEFTDGKLMFGKHDSLREVTWANIQERFGRKKFEQHFYHASLLGFVNWTMLPHLSEIWQSLQVELCPHVKGPRRKLFFDLCDPEKRSKNDLAQALDLIVKFNRYFDVILGLNEKEALAVASVLNLAPKPATTDGLTVLASELSQRLPVATVLVHPTAYAIAASAGKAVRVDGPFTKTPLITTGAGDHFNAGFCLGNLLGLEHAESLLCGVATSGYYVRTGKSPGIPDLAALLRNWPAN